MYFYLTEFNPIPSLHIPSQPVKRAPPATLDMDEDAQLQLALNLSKEEHKQVKSL